MSQDNKTFFDLCNDTLEELYYETVDTFEELADLPEGKKVKKELNRALVYICNNERNAWQFRDCNIDIMLVPGLNEYDMPNGFIKYLKYPFENQLLTYCEDHKFLPINTGKPLYYWFDDDDKIKVYPIPTIDDANRIIHCSFYTNDFAKDCRGVYKSEMDQACDVPIIPRHHRNILVYKVCADWRANSNDARSVYYDRKFREAYRALLTDQRLSNDLPNGLNLGDQGQTYKDTLLNIFYNPYSSTSRSIRDK